MLQRIQTVYLFLVFVFCLLYILFPLATINVDSDLFKLKAFDAIVDEVNVLLLQAILLVVLFSIMVLTIITTFKYKKRLFQIRLGKLNMLLLLVLIVLSFFYIDSVKVHLNGEVEYGAGIFFPVISMILILFANRAIRKDEELVRSADRIR